MLSSLTFQGKRRKKITVRKVSLNWARMTIKGPEDQEEGERQGVKRVTCIGQVSFFFKR